MSFCYMRNFLNSFKCLTLEQFFEKLRIFCFRVFENVHMFTNVCYVWICYIFCVSMKTSGSLIHGSLKSQS